MTGSNSHDRAARLRRLIFPAAARQRNRSWLLLLSIVAFFLIPAAAAVQTSIVIHGVTIVDIRDGTLRSGQAVLIEGDRIAAVGADDEIEAPGEAEVIDGSGHYLIPGLWDMHVHSVTNRAWHFPLLLAHGVTGVRNMHSTEADPLDKVAAVKQELDSGELLGPRFIANGAIVDGPPGIWPGTIVVASPEEAVGV